MRGIDDDECIHICDDDDKDDDDEEEDDSGRSLTLAVMALRGAAN